MNLYLIAAVLVLVMGLFGWANFERAEAIHAFASDYHGGQGSDLYRVLSQSPFRPGPLWRTSDAAPDMIETLVTNVEYA